MTTPHVQNFASLRDEMIAVARGERKAPRHATEAWAVIVGEAREDPRLNARQEL